MTLRARPARAACIAATIMLFLAQLGCGRQATVAGDDGMRIPLAEMARVLRSARGGDLESMHRLAVHYATVDDIASYRFWLTESADRGDCAAIAELVQSYTIPPPSNVPDKRIASAWTDRSRSLGCPSQ